MIDDYYERTAKFPLIQRLVTISVVNAAKPLKQNSEFVLAAKKRAQYSRHFERCELALTTD